MAHKKVLSSFVGTSGFAIAASVVLVGMVWAGGSALRTDESSSAVTTSTALETTDSTVASPTSDSSPSTVSDPTVSEFSRLVQRLDDKVTELAAEIATHREDVDDAIAKSAQRMDTMAKSISEIVDDMKSASARLDKVADDARKARAEASEVRTLVDALTARLDVVEAKTVKMNEVGDYSGPIAPSQLTRRLSPSDINGDWPLDRVTGLLSAQDIEVDASGCWADSRYNTVMGVDAFRRVTCLRLPK